MEITYHRRKEGEENSGRDHQNSGGLSEPKRGLTYATVTLTLFGLALILRYGVVPAPDSYYFLKLLHIPEPVAPWITFVLFGVAVGVGYYKHGAKYALALPLLLTLARFEDDVPALILLSAGGMFAWVSVLLWKGALFYMIADSLAKTLSKKPMLLIPLYVALALWWHIPRLGLAEGFNPAGSFIMLVPMLLHMRKPSAREIFWIAIGMSDLKLSAFTALALLDHMRPPKDEYVWAALGMFFVAILFAPPTPGEYIAAKQACDLNGVRVYWDIGHVYNYVCDKNVPAGHPMDWNCIPPALGHEKCGECVEYIWFGQRSVYLCRR